jgi:hypothetical protein
MTPTGRLFVLAMACCAMNRRYVLDAVRAELGDAAADALAESMAQQDEPAANAAPEVMRGPNDRLN